MSDDPIDLSVLSLSADPDSRAALVDRIVAAYVARRGLTVWSAIVGLRGPVIGLVAASALAAAALTRRPPVAAPIPQPVEQWMARGSTPSPLEVMFAMAEIPR